MKNRSILHESRLAFLRNAQAKDEKTFFYYFPKNNS